MLEIQLAGENVKIYPEKVLLWKESLLLADLHLGKITHFRKNGLPIPEKAIVENIERLIDVINMTLPKHIYFLGDLFHSHYNREWEEFKQLRQHFSSINFTLVQGNHDIMSNYRYESVEMELVEEAALGPFSLRHEPLEDDLSNPSAYSICGHLHPSAVLTGRGRQKISLPCFHFMPNQGVLPAFGAFTGNSRIKKGKNDRVYVIAGSQILEK